MGFSYFYKNERGNNMSKSSVSKFIKSAQILVSKHSPEILIGIGIAGMVSTTVLAVKATPKALQLIEEKKDELEVGKLTPAETIKATWKCYIPAAITGATSVACLIGASSVHARRNAALATAYKLSETALTEYKDKVVETIGEKKEQAVRDAIAQDKIKSDPVSKKEVILTGKGDTLCYDIMCKRYFKSDIDKLKKIENELNRRMRSENYISLNEFYYEVGLDDVAVGYEFGWNIDRGYIELEFSSQLADDGTPCLVVGFVNPPDYDYRY